MKYLKSNKKITVKSVGYWRVMQMKRYITSLPRGRHTSVLTPCRWCDKFYFSKVSFLMYNISIKRLKWNENMNIRKSGKKGKKGFLRRYLVKNNCENILWGCFRMVLMDWRISGRSCFVVVCWWRGEWGWFFQFKNGYIRYSFPILLNRSSFLQKSAGSAE